MKLAAEKLVSLRLSQLMTLEGNCVDFIPVKLQVLMASGWLCGVLHLIFNKSETAEGPITLENILPGSSPQKGPPVDPQRLQASGSDFTRYESAGETSPETYASAGRTLAGPPTVCLSAPYRCGGHHHLSAKPGLCYSIESMKVKEKSWTKGAINLKT